MKYILHCCVSLCLLLPHSTLGQESDGLRLSYEYQNRGSGTRQRVSLYVKGNECFSEFSTAESLNEHEAEPKDFSISGEDSLGRQVYRNASTQELIFRDFASVDGEFQAFIVRDPLTAMQWSFTKEQRTIGNYKCNKATTNYRGRSYVVWYTDQVPVVHGPWKFTGLPGAMVEIRSAEDAVVFNLIRVEKLGGRLINKPTQGKAISMEEYVYLRKEAINDFIRILKTKLPRGAEVTVEATGDYNLETDFSDVKK